MVVIPYRSMVTSLTKVAERGVSSSGLSRPKTVLEGFFSSRPTLSAVTTTSETVEAAGAAAAAPAAATGAARDPSSAHAAQAAIRLNSDIPANKPDFNMKPPRWTSKARPACADIPLKTFAPITNLHQKKLAMKARLKFQMKCQWRGEIPPKFLSAGA